MSPDIGQNSDGDISDYRISGQSPIKWNSHDSRISGDIDMKLGPVTKFDRESKARSKKVDNDVLSENCDVSAIFPFCNQSGAIWKLDSGCIACKTYILINSNYLSYKTENRNKKSH